MLACPQCGSAIEPAMPGLPVVTCPSCVAMVLIDGGRIEHVGDSGRMPFDVSPLQIGTTLMVDGARGEIVGRERWAWDRGSWNEWLLQLPGADHRWVAEEAGYYMVMAAIQPRADVGRRMAELGRLGRAALGTSVTVDKVSYTVADVKTVFCVASEGHLPHIVPTALQRQSVDLRSRSGAVLTWQKDRVDSGWWLGAYHTLEQLSPQGLRRFEGWPVPDFGKVLPA